MKKYYIDKRVLVSGKNSILSLANFIGFNEIVNAIVTNGSSTLPFVFQNGITETAGNVELGGTLLDTTTINGDDNVLEIADASIKFTGSDTHDFNSTITTIATTTVIQNTLSGPQLRKTDANGTISSVSVYDVLGVTNVILTLKDPSLNVITMTLVPNGGNGFPSLKIEGLQEYADETAATTAGLQPNMVYVTTATNALTIVSSGF